MKKHLLLVFSLSLFILTFAFLFPVSAQSLEGYCANGYYEIPGEKKCSRAPGCGGPPYDNYDYVAQNVPAPNPNDCIDVSMVTGNPPNTNVDDGYFPLCCYEMERTGDFTKCVGYWERLWCAVSQCDEARAKGASDSQCGGNCQCAHTTVGYGYSNIQPLPLSTRLSGVIATPTPTGQPCLPQKKAGDYDCSGMVNASDFDAWKTDFLAARTTLSFFEYWRRIAFSQ